MKSAIVVAHQYWPTPGSATQRLSAMVGELCREGLDVHVITCKPSGDVRLIEYGPHGESIHYASGAEVTGSGMRRVLALMAFAVGVIKKGWALPYELVITDPPPTAAWAARRLARRNSAQFIYYMCDSWGGVTRDSSSRLATLAHPFVRTLEDGLLRSSDAVIAVTSRMRQLAEIAGSERVHLVENGVPLDTFSPSGTTWSPNESGRPFFLYAGNAGVVHGADVFARAADELWVAGHEFDLVYMGHGADIPLIRNVQARWTDRLWTVPTQSPKVVAAAYRGALGALSSLRPFESYQDARPIKSLAGLASGCPPIYAGDGDFADLLRAEELGYVSEWSPEGALLSMETALLLQRDEPERMQDLRQRCARFARMRLDDQIAAREVVSHILARGDVA